jgi:hypothetical protein
LLTANRLSGPHEGGRLRDRIQRRLKLPVVLVPWLLPSLLSPPSRGPAGAVAVAPKNGGAVNGTTGQTDTQPQPGGGGGGSDSKVAGGAEANRNSESAVCKGRTDSGADKGESWWR